MPTRADLPLVGLMLGMLLLLLILTYKSMFAMLGIFPEPPRMPSSDTVNPAASCHYRPEHGCNFRKDI